MGYDAIFVRVPLEKGDYSVVPLHSCLFKRAHSVSPVFAYQQIENECLKIAECDCWKAWTILPSFYDLLLVFLPRGYAQM